MEIESEPGRGTTFVIRLPIQPAATTASMPVVAPDFLTRKLRVLVVDDAPLVRAITEEFLTSDGHTVEAVATGAIALARLADGGFDVVITDKAMPDMNGEQLAVAIHRSASGVPVILMTGFGDIMKAAGEMPPHVRAILSKPFTTSTLRTALAKVLPLQ